MTTATLGPVELDGAFRARTAGGWNAPEKTVDRDFDYQSFVQNQPVELSFEAVVTDDELEQLQSLRDDEDEPFPASVGNFEIAEAQLPELEVEQMASMKSHVRVTGTVREVFQAGVESSEYVIEVPDGGAQSGDGGGDTSSSGLVDTSADDTGETDRSEPEADTDDESDDDSDWWPFW